MSGDTVMGVIVALLFVLLCSLIAALVTIEVQRGLAVAAKSGHYEVSQEGRVSFVYECKP